LIFFLSNLLKISFERSASVNIYIYRCRSFK
jgi:hypothetical protein